MKFLGKKKTVKARPKFEIHLATIFPEYFTTPLQQSLIKKALAAEKVAIQIHNLRDFTQDRHKTVDDKPFGGGAGMVMKPEPIFSCVEKIIGKGAKKRSSAWVILLDPKGEPLTQRIAHQLAEKNKLILILGHYEGIDDRVREHLVDQVISLGDYITMGGEGPALCLMEAVIRLIPGVVGNQDSLLHESFEKNVLEYPQYTRPQNFRGWNVPEVLVSGDHKQVRLWREKMSQVITKKNRPDLMKE